MIFLVYRKGGFIREPQRGHWMRVYSNSLHVKPAVNVRVWQSPYLQWLGEFDKIPTCSDWDTLTKSLPGVTARVWRSPSVRPHCCPGLSAASGSSASTCTHHSPTASGTHALILSVIENSTVTSSFIFVHPVDSIPLKMPISCLQH